MITLRPHHLLCTQSYEGRGYSPEFVANMDRITDQLRTSDEIQIRLTLGTDDLCTACPNKVTENTCNTDDHVRTLDQNVLDAFRLEESTYNYQALIRKMRAESTPAIIEKICGDCSWYLNDSCRVQRCMAASERPQSTSSDIEAPSLLQSKRSQIT